MSKAITLNGAYRDHKKFSPQDQHTSKYWGPYRSKFNKAVAWKTHPTGRGMETGPSNNPGPTILRFPPKRMQHSLRRESVQNGRTKSWWSM